MEPFYFAAGALLLGLLGWWSLNPAAFVRFVHRFVYRRFRHGLPNVPSQGPAILVYSQVPGFGWVHAWLAPPRPVRLLIFAPESTSWWDRLLIRWSGVIVLDPAGGLRSVVQSLRFVRQALQRGELVGVFAEDRQLASGFRLTFGRLFRQIVGRASRTGYTCPVIPVEIAQPRGSLYYRQAGRLRRHRPDELRHEVHVTFGGPLSTKDPAEIWQALQHLSADAAIARSKNIVPVHRQFVRVASRHPFRRCIYDTAGRKELSYGKALAGAMCLGNRLRPIIGDKPIVGLWLPSGPGGVLANIALALLGRTSVNLNYTASAEAVRSAIRQCNIRHVLTARRFTAHVALDAGPNVELVYLDDLLPTITTGQRVRAFLKVLLLPTFLLERWVLGLGRHSGDDLATIVFSSGSTGDPKGVMLTHRNVAANVESMVRLAEFKRWDRLLGVLPLFHSFGYTVTMWAPLSFGASAVYHADPRQAKEIGELCRTQGCTIYLSTATFLRFCLRKCQPDDFRTLRQLICGAEKLPPSLGEEFHSRFGVWPREGYGCTEMSPTVSTNVDDIAIGDSIQINNRTGSIGRLTPGVAVRVVEPDTLEPLPIGQEGLLLVRGANVMKGYLHREDLTAAAVVNAEYRTGDMARIDADGFVTLTGRLARFAKIGGEMVPLELIEEELHALLDTTERILAVSSVPDEKKGERLVVLHVAAALDDIRGLCRRLSDRGLPNLWVPGERDFHAVPHLPLLGSGKLDLRQVKELALAAVSEKLGG